MILVVGATGSLGGRITRGLLAQGKAVRILARDNPISAELAKQGRANTAASLVEAGAQAVYGDLKARASLDAALAGVDTVITTATATQRGGDDTVPAVDLQGTLSLIEAARAAGVKRFIYTSAYGSVPGHPVPLFNVKGTCEAALEQSGLEYTILWPAVFMEVWIGMVVGVPLMAQQPITLIGQGDHRHNLVSDGVRHRRGGQSAGGQPAHRHRWAGVLLMDRDRTCCRRSDGRVAACDLPTVGFGRPAAAARSEQLAQRHGDLRDLCGYDRDRAGLRRRAHNFG